MESSRIGYSSAGALNDYIVLFEISLPHNLHRQVKNKWNALYRCKKAYPLMIFHKETGKKVEQIESSETPDLIYKINTFVMVDNYEHTNAVEGRGIYFYLSRDPAYFHKYSPPSGLNMKWDTDGCLLRKVYRGDNKKLTGECIWYYPDINPPTPCKIINFSSGIMKRFDPTGVQVSESTYIDGKLDGIFTKYIDGIISFSCEYKEGKKHGQHITYDNGLKDGEFTYENNVLNGPFKMWSQGKLRAEGGVNDGILDGVYDQYSGQYKEKYKNNKLVGTIKTRKFPNQTINCKNEI